MTTAKIPLGLNVNYVLRDKNGGIKPIFQDNRLCIALIRAGRLNPEWINKWYAPIVAPFLGSYADNKLVKNLIVNAGAATVAGLLNGSLSSPVFQYISVGLGTAAAAATDTALVSEITDSGLARGTATASRATTDVTNDTARLVLSYTVTGTKAVAESGVFNHITVAQGTCLARQVFSAINVVSGDTLQITWDIDVD